MGMGVSHHVKILFDIFIVSLLILLLFRARLFIEKVVNVDDPETKYGCNKYSCLSTPVAVSIPLTDICQIHQYVPFQLQPNKSHPAPSCGDVFT